MESSSRRRVVLFAIALAAFALRVAGAQQSSARGRVATPGVVDVPVAGAMVTLHRVGTDSSGAIDSVRTDAAGRYALTFARYGDADAVYFAAAVFRGIAYFSAPLRAMNTAGGDADITVFDTTTRKIRFTVQGHHLVIGAPRPNGVRDVIEVWELSNDTTLTVIGRDSLTPVWSAVLPRGATKVTGGAGDVTPGAIVAVGDRVQLRAPFGPGVKQVSYTYMIEAGDFPLTLPLEANTSVLEVLVEEPTAQVSGADLRATENAVTQGRSFRRYLAQDVLAGNSVTIRVPATTASTRTRLLASLGTAIVVAMAGALVFALRRRRRVPAPQSLDREALLTAMAALDARHDAGDPTLDAATYAAERAALKTQLRSDNRPV